MGWPGPRRRAVPLRLSEEEERPVREIAAAEHDGNLSETIRVLLVEALAARTTTNEPQRPARFSDVVGAERAAEYHRQDRTAEDAARQLTRRPRR